jgi:serine/threonine protein kinase
MLLDDNNLERYPSNWSDSSSSSSSSSPTEEVIAITPYSRITRLETRSYGLIARKRLEAGRHPPHDPLRELAILKLITASEPPEDVNVIPLVEYDVLPSGRVVLDFPLQDTDLKQVFLTRKSDIAKDGELVRLIMSRFLEVLRGLGWIHELGIVHRDVNPSNIFLSHDLARPAFLGDFGISWMANYPDNPDEGVEKYSSGVGTGYSPS